METRSQSVSKNLDKRVDLLNPDLKRVLEVKIDDNEDMLLDTLKPFPKSSTNKRSCLLYTSDAADE